MRLKFVGQNSSEILLKWKVSACVWRLANNYHCGSKKTCKVSFCLQSLCQFAGLWGHCRFARTTRLWQRKAANGSQSAGMRCARLWEVGGGDTERVGLSADSSWSAHIRWARYWSLHARTQVETARMKFRDEDFERRFQEAQVWYNIYIYLYQLLTGSVLADSEFICALIFSSFEELRQYLNIQVHHKTKSMKTIDLAFFIFIPHHLII